MQPASLLATFAVCAANPIPDRREPVALITRAHLLSLLGCPTQGTQFWGGIEQASRLGPDYVWVLEDVLRTWPDSDCRPIRSVFMALGRIADETSIATLRAALADTESSALCRTLAAEGLALACDRESIPLMKKIAATNGDPLLVQGLSRAADRMEHPGAYRPLLGLAADHVYFGFLANDMERSSATRGRGALEVERASSSSALRVRRVR